MPRVVVALLAAVLFAGCAPASAPPSVAQRLTDYLNGLVSRQQFRGAVSVRRGDEVLLMRGYDRANATEPNGPHTRFRIASLTKQFTALAMLILQEQGKLAVSDPVCAHLPNCPAAWQAITVEHLLTHTAGLVNYTDVDEVAAERFFTQIGTRQPSPDQLISTFADQPLEFPPGTAWRYTNSAYVVLGRLVELLSGESYGQFLRHRILDPLDMTDTGYHPAGGAGDALSYVDWSNPGDPYTPAVAFASGGLHSTVTDLARWQQFLLTGEPAAIAPAARTQLLRPGVATRGDERYGYGIQTRGSDATLTYFHSGSGTGVATYLELQPSRKLSVVVLSNLDNVNASSIGRNLIALAL